MFKFKSKSHVAINVVMPGGANAHIAFMEVTGGGSVYYTNNPDVASALRQHSKFGRLFKEVEVIEKPVVKKQSAPKAESQQAAGDGLKEMEFKNNEDAKDYLAERYGISRSKMKTRAAIEESAKGVGLKVKWVA